MAEKRINITIDSETLKEIDRLAKIDKRSRNKFLSVKLNEIFLQGKMVTCTEENISINAEENEKSSIASDLKPKNVANF